MLGQFNEIIWHMLSMRIDSEAFCRRRDIAEEYLYKARTYIYPDLYGVGHSYGIAQNQKASSVFDVYQVCRNVVCTHKSPPFSNNELPEIKAVDDGYQLILPKEQLNLIAEACHFYYRISLGHFDDIFAACNVDVNKQAQHYLNLAKAQIITHLTHVSNDSLAIYEIIHARYIGL